MRIKDAGLLYGFLAGGGLATNLEILVIAEGLAQRIDDLRMVVNYQYSFFHSPPIRTLLRWLFEHDGDQGGIRVKP